MGPISPLTQWGPVVSEAPARERPRVPGRRCSAQHFETVVEMEEASQTKSRYHAVTKLKCQGKEVVN